MDNYAHEPQRSSGSTTVNQPGAELYKQIFVHSNEAIAIIDPEGHYLEQNRAHRQLLGYTDEDLHGQTPAIHMGADAFAALASELAAQGTFNGDVTSRTRSGEAKEIELSAFAMRKADGTVTCYVGIKRDISARKLHEEALRRSELELSDFFDNAAIGLHWVGPNGIVVRVNQAHLDLLGCTRKEYIGHHISEFYVDEHAVEDILASLQRGDAVYDYEARMRCRDGAIKIVRINSSVYRENGQFIHSRSFLLDVTDRKRAEQRLALQYAVTRNLSEATDISDSVLRVLRAVCEILGWQVGLIWRVEKDGENLGCENLWYADNAKMAEFGKACKEMKFARGVGLPGRIWKSGQPDWILNVLADDNFLRTRAAASAGLQTGFGFPIVVGSEVIGIIEFFAREITPPDPELLQLVNSVGGQIGQFQERKRAEGELAKILLLERSARAEAEQANRLKDEFLATVSHELRTPLNAMMGWARMLRSGRLDSESREHAIEVIERNAWAQKQIIEDILDVSRVITGKLQLNLAPVDLGLVADAALDAVRPALEAKEIQITKHLDPRVRVIAADGDRLQQVIWNLLSNAAKFTPAGGRIELSIQRAGNSIQIQVSDTGTGIAPEFLPHVFERFRQADGSTTRTHGGLGLGLAIVRHLVELHGGSIKAENRKEGQGAILTVTLPLPSGELRLDDLPAMQAEEAESSAAAPDLTGVHVLVVDDEADARDLIAIDLAACGAKVTSHESVTEALEALKTAQFDLVISDIGMPEYDGYQFIRKLRAMEIAEQRRKVPAVALTAYARVQDRVRALIAGYDTHVSKPLECGELVTVAASLVGRLAKK